jgi:amidase
MARSVVDVAIMLDAMAGFDPRDPTSLQDDLPSIFEELDRGIEGLRIGLDREYAFDDVDPGLVESLEEALEVLTNLGAKVVEVSLPDMTDVSAMWFLLCSAEAALTHREYYPSRAEEYGPYFREFLEVGSKATEEQLAKARIFRAKLTDQLNTALADVDALVCPAGGAPAFPISPEAQYGSMTEFNQAIETIFQSFDQPRKGGQLFTMPMNLAGIPAICLPSGFSPEGLPYSVQFAGRRLSETVLCQIAYAYEQATNWHTRHPNIDAG